jgi:hypothetical protein
MNYARLSSLLCVSLLTGVLAASCTSTHDTADVVPSPPGAFQPDGGGKTLDEATACSQLTAAESTARSALGCDAAKHTCPDYIRPAGGADCFVYDQASVDGCATLYNSFTSCDDFDSRPCLLTAESNCDQRAPDSGVASDGGGGQPSVDEPAAGGAPTDTGAGGASTAGASF